MIIESHNDYLIGVKKNQRRLYEQIEAITAQRSNQSSCYTTLELNKGRREYRCVTVSDRVETMHKGWRGLQQVVRVHRRVSGKGRKSEQIAYFISSRKSNAIWYQEGIRSHWSIENSLHWVKDVTLREDASSIKKGHAPQNISILKNMGINILRANKYTSIAQGIRLVANDIKLLYRLIT